ncbi:hypothetical protein G6011_09731 [Alternaria panax]|uniref:Uncharacterized protein n=1 Tax=Alternaria panax TaxID=48097 RepID=A0AAD4FB04_9PLEO|nr:hypothetical protein G6011_09731 [Alternaria panax]
MTPNKRKAHSSHERTPTRKLQKPSKSARTIPVLTQQRRDPYSIPISPPVFSNLNRSSFERRRETTQDTDATYMPREVTADAETVFDGTEVVPPEVGPSIDPRTGKASKLTHNPDSCLQNAIAMATVDEMQYEYEDENAAGPSGTYRNPLRQDSVIPNDTQPPNDAIETDTHFSSGQPGQNKDTTSDDAYNDAILRSLIFDSEPETRQNRYYRLELVRLLISYLNSINEFDSTSYNFAAEERMNFLLNHFQCIEKEIWHANHNDSAIRLHRALERWMSMRHRLSAFRSATGYFGPPGQRWEEFLRGLNNVPHAEAILAFVQLKDDRDLEEGRGEGVGVGPRFDEDLMVVFDGLTRMKGCNGPGAFKNVKSFNKGLLEWFEE